MKKIILKFNLFENILYKQIDDIGIRVSDMGGYKKFSDKEVLSITGIVKKFKITDNFDITPSNSRKSIKLSDRRDNNIVITKDNDYNYYVMLDFADHDGDYQCDDIDGLSQLLSIVLGSYYISVDHIDSVRSEIIEMIDKIKSKEELLKIKNFIKVKESLLFESNKNEKLYKKIQIPYNTMRSIIKDRKLNIKFTEKDIDDIKNLLKNYKYFFNKKNIIIINFDPLRCEHNYILNGDNLEYNDITISMSEDPYSSTKNKILILKDNDEYYYMYSFSSYYYKCDTIEGLLQCLKECIFKNYKKHDFDIEQIRNNLISSIKKMNKDELMKIKDMI